MSTVRLSLEELDSSFPNGIDVLICSSSFEDRSLSVPFCFRRTEVRHAIVAVNRTFEDIVGRNFARLRDHFGSRFHEMSLDANDPLRSADGISKSLDALAPPVKKSILVDISTFTRESLLILLLFLRYNVRSGDEIRFVYARAKEYSIGEDPENKWLSKGIRDIRSVLGYPGEHSPLKKTHMIVMVGYEDERAVSLINEMEPHSVSLGLLDESEHAGDNHHRTNSERFARLKKRLREVEEFTFSGYDPLVTKADLEQQVEAHKECNILIAPMNTKISTIGAALCAFDRPAVQLCYAPANVYNWKAYSQPDEDCFLFSVPHVPFPEHK